MKKNLFTEIDFLGADYIKDLIDYKNQNFVTTYENLIKEFGIENDINSDDVDNNYIIYLLSKFYERGFYAGANYVIDPENNDPTTFKKIYNYKLNGHSNN